MCHCDEKPFFESRCGNSYPFLLEKTHSSFPQSKQHSILVTRLRIQDALGQHCSNRLSGKTSLQNQKLNLWLPYPNRQIAKCAQGAMSQHTHRGVHAWDFVLPADTPITAVKGGRVIFLIDNSTATGFNDFALSNMIFVDIGGCRFAAYLHHEPNTALVELGEKIQTGTNLAIVGSSGTISPHLHFDVRGGGWNTSHPVLFKTTNELAKAQEGQCYQSVTPGPSTIDAEPFEDSILTGTEFLENGIELEPGLPAYSLSSNKKIVYRGRTLKKSKYIFFDLWRMDQRGTSLSVYAIPNSEGRFSLHVQIHDFLNGCYWYRISAKNRSGSVLLPTRIVRS
jgi:hypothetical protein